MPSGDRDQVFICYSRKDKRWLERLLETLELLASYHSVHHWWDGKIPDGEDWQQEIDDALDRAKVAVLLVSRGSLATKFIREIELPYLLDAAKTKEVKLLWVPVGASLFGSGSV